MLLILSGSEPATPAEAWCIQIVPVRVEPSRLNADEVSLLVRHGERPDRRPATTVALRRGRGQETDWPAEQLESPTIDN
jgi:hypothetical protein